MSFTGTHAMPDADHIIVTTKLSYCDNASLNLSQTTYDLEKFYQSNISNLTSNVFFNITINNFNCTEGVENYFQQIITFTEAVSIRIQILFASIYFDYINANNYRLNGFIIDSNTLFNLSSITVNNSNTSNACSSAEAAQDPLCLTNLTNSVCTILLNPWTFICSQELVTTTSSLLGSSLLERTVMPSGLNSWQLGLVCGFSILFGLILILLFGFFYRRYRHSKQLALSRVNLYDDGKLMQKNGIPQGQAFQRATTIIQPKRRNYTATSWIHDVTTTNVVRNDENYINVKLPEPYNQITFVDHAKIHDSDFPSNIPEELLTSVDIRTSPSNRIEPTIISRPVSETSVNELKLIPNGLQDKLNESDNISIDQSNSSSPNKPSTPISRQFENLSFVDENLNDEDAWMSILDIVNIELAKLNEQDRISTFM